MFLKLKIALIKFIYDINCIIFSKLNKLLLISTYFTVKKCLLIRIFKNLIIKIVINHILIIE